jgi:drug/metabolite transporter (DMT)-like permease
MHLDSISGIGEIFSLASAVLWALSLVLFRRAGDVMAPATLNFYKGVVAVVFIVPTMLILGVKFFPDNVTIYDWGLMLLSGLVGMGIADTILFTSLNRLGPGRYAIISCMFGPMVILISTIWLHEPISITVLIAAAMIITAIIISAWRPRGSENSVKLLTPYLMGALGVMLIAVSIVAAKPVLNRTDGVWGAFARLCGGMLFLTIQNLLPWNIKKTIAALSPGPHHIKALPPSFIGAYACTVLWTLGMKYTWASNAAVMNQLTNIMIFPFAALILKEKVQPRQILAVSIGVAAGILIASGI